MIYPIYYFSDTRDLFVDSIFSDESDYQDHKDLHKASEMHFQNMPLHSKLENLKKKTQKLEHKVNKAEWKANDRSGFRARRNRWALGAIGTRLRNWASGTGYRGDVRANKLARLQNKQARIAAKQNYLHNKIALNEKHHEENNNLD